MKTRLGVIVLAIACIVLVIALLATKQQADHQRRKDADTILDFSNQWVATSANLDELRQVNLILTNDLDTTRQRLLMLSNQTAEASDKLASAETVLKDAQDQLANLNGRVGDLETQNRMLDQQVLALTNLITSLNAQIDATQTKLAGAESDKTFLGNELKRLTAEKAQLERKFNSLTALHTQVRKLHDELVVSRRLEWRRGGVSSASGKKGAEMLMERNWAENASASPGRSPHYDLNVEVGSDGSIRVIPVPTNAPALTNPPSQ